MKAFVRRRIFGYSEKRFASHPRLWDAVLPVLYLNSPDTGNRFGFIRDPVHTIMIDLTLSDAALLKSFRSNTRYEILRAAREGARFAVNTDHRRFLSFYADAARNRPLPSTEPDYLQSLGENARITEGLLDSELLVTHLYIVDRPSGRVRLIRSASMFRQLDKTKQSTIGRINRYLHYQDMLHFKSTGLRWYDMGGYFPREIATTDDMRSVSEFKTSFGGKSVQEANYLSAAQYIYRHLHAFLK